MVGIFAGLKWRLVTSRIRTTRGATRGWLIVGWVLASVVLLLLAAGLMALRSHPDVARIVVTTLFSAQFLSWGLAPLVAFGVDETIDPAKFALLPLPRRTLQTGLLVSSLVGYLPLANLVVLLGAAVALSAQWWLLPIALLCGAVQLVGCVMFSRALSTAMSGLMSGRRGRDLGVMVGFGVFVVYMGLTYLLNTSGSDDTFGNGVSTLSNILSWAPPGALAQLPGRLAGGDWLRVVISAATAAATLALLWWWWAVALDRSLTTVPSTTENSAPAAGDHNRAIADSLSGTIRVVAGRDRVLAWRDPMRRVPWLTVIFLALFWPFLVVHGHGSVFAVVLPALLSSSLAGNFYGMDGSGMWLHMVTFADRARARGEALGHALTAVVPGALIVILACVVQVAVRGDWQMLPAGLGVCLAGLLGGSGTAAYLSARLPFAVRQSRKSMFASSIPGQKGRTAAASLGTLAGGLVTALPAAALAVLSLVFDPVWGWAALIVGPVTGVGVLLLMSGWTASAFLDRAPEILAVVAIGDRS